MTRTDALRKVRALLATAAKGSGATEPERQTAKRLADKLTAEHRLNEADVVGGERPQLPPSLRGFSVVVNVNGFNWTFNDQTASTGGY